MTKIATFDVDKYMIRLINCCDIIHEREVDIINDLHAIDALNPIKLGSRDTKKSTINPYHVVGDSINGDQKSVIIDFVICRQSSSGNQGCVHPRIPVLARHVCGRSHSHIPGDLRTSVANSFYAASHTAITIWHGL